MQKCIPYLKLKSQWDMCRNKGTKRLTCRETVRASGKYQAAMMPSESTIEEGRDTNGKGLSNNGGNCSAI
jgi:hypothetical protein